MNNWIKTQDIDCRRPHRKLRVFSGFYSAMHKYIYVMYHLKQAGDFIQATYSCLSKLESFVWYVYNTVCFFSCMCVCARVNGSRSNGALGADKGSTKRGTKEATLPLCPCATTTSSFYLSFI